MTTTRCPVCRHEVPIRDGRLIRHHGDQMRWSGVRWFRTTCTGSGRATTQDAPGLAETPLGATRGAGVDPNATAVIRGRENGDSA